MFSKETYISRRNRLKKEVGKGILLFMGNNENPMNYADNTYHFRQDSSFLYFFGLKHPGLAAILDCESGEEILYGDNYTIDDIVWMGKQPTIAERATSCGVFKVAAGSAIPMTAVRRIAAMCSPTCASAISAFASQWTFKIRSIKRKHFI